MCVWGVGGVNATYGHLEMSVSPYRFQEARTTSPEVSLAEVFEITLFWSHHPVSGRLDKGLDGGSDYVQRGCGHWVRRMKERDGGLGVVAIPEDWVVKYLVWSMKMCYRQALEWFQRQGGLGITGWYGKPNMYQNKHPCLYRNADLNLYRHKDHRQEVAYFDVRRNFSGSETFHNFTAQIGQICNLKFEREESKISVRF